MLPSRSTLSGWNPDSLTASATGVTSAATSVSDAVTGIDDALRRMPETRAWAGRSHDAATAMFGRADGDAGRFSTYVSDVASALRQGGARLAQARIALLNKADQVDAGPLNVTDQWAVLIDPVRMSADEMAHVVALADEEQSAINALLAAVGAADDDTANAVAAASRQFGFAEDAPSNDPFAIPTSTRPRDEVPNPRDPVGLIEQQAIRDGDMSISIREVTHTVNQHGEEAQTVVMQDGSEQVMTRNSPFDWPDRENFYTVVQYDKRGRETSRTSSWHDFGNACNYTSVTWPDGSNYTMSMDPTGYRNAGFTTAGGRHSAVPVELIDRISLVGGSGMSGMEKHLERGGGLPMVTAASLEDVGRATKFGGPALTIATTVFDMANAATRHEACAALFSGVVGAGGGWAGAEGGAAVGALFGPADAFTVPFLATAGALGGGYWTGELGKVIGDVVCPY